MQILGDLNKQYVFSYDRAKSAIHRKVLLEISPQMLDFYALHKQYFCTYGSRRQTAVHINAI